MKYLKLIYIIPLLVLSAFQDKVGKEGFVDVAGADIYYKTTGKGQPLLIIHGGPGLSHDYLFPSLQPLAANNQLIFYDQRASGNSNKGITLESVRLDTFLTDIDAVRKYFGIKKLKIMAHSFGGLLALKYAIRYPQNVSSIVPDMFDITKFPTK